MSQAQKSRVTQKYRLRQIIFTVLESIPIVLTVIFGVYAAINVQQTPENIPSLLFWILTIVTLIASSEILMRARILSRIEKGTDSAEEALNHMRVVVDEVLSIQKGNPRADDIIITRDKIIEFHDRIVNAEEIWICGLTLSSIVKPKYYQILRDRARKGAKIKVIVSDPQGNSLVGAVKSIEPAPTKDDLTDEIDRTITSFYRLYTDFPNADIKMGFLDAPMTSGIIVTDPGTDKARAHMEIYSYRAPVYDRPHIELVEKIDSKWYKYVKEEFERRWAQSSQVIPFLSIKHPVNEIVISQTPITVFIDRDGVINQLPPTGNYVTSASQFVFENGAIDAIKELISKGFRVIIATNQAGIGRGMIGDSDLSQIHDTIIAAVNTSNGGVSAIYTCPHRIEVNCICRKPRSGLLLRAKLEMGVNLQRSYFIGDAETDIVAGSFYRCKTILVGSGTGKVNANHPDYIVGSLMEAVKKIIEIEGK